MGGDQLNQLISEYINNNIGNFIFAFVIMALALITIIAGIVLTIVFSVRKPKEITENASSSSDGGNDNV